MFHAPFATFAASPAAADDAPFSFSCSQQQLLKHTVFSMLSHLKAVLALAINSHGLVSRGLK